MQRSGGPRVVTATPAVASLGRRSSCEAACMAAPATGQRARRRSRSSVSGSLRERCGYGAPGFAPGAAGLAHRRFLRATRSNGPRASAPACGCRGVWLGGAGDSSRRGNPAVCGAALDRRWRKPSALGALITPHHAHRAIRPKPVPARFLWPSAPFVPVPDVIAPTPVRGCVRCWRLVARHPPRGASAPGGVGAECGGGPALPGGRPGSTVRFAAPAVAARAGGAPDAVQPGTSVSGTARRTGWEPDGRRRGAFAGEQSTDVRTAGAQRAHGRFAGPGARRSLAGRPPRSPRRATPPGTHGPRAAGSTRCPNLACRVRAAHPTDRVRDRVRRVVQSTSGVAPRPAPSGAGHGRGPDRDGAVGGLQAGRFPQGTFAGTLVPETTSCRSGGAGRERSPVATPAVRASNVAMCCDITSKRCRRDSGHEPRAWKDGAMVYLIAATRWGEDREGVERQGGIAQPIRR
jgi:hypothetical protein